MKRKRTLKGVDGCNLGQKQKQKRLQLQLLLMLLLRRLLGTSKQDQKRGHGKHKQDQKRRKTSPMGSAGGFINCARLPEPSHCLSGSTDHQQQRLHNSILPCFIPYKAAHEGHETLYCFSPFGQGMSYTLGSRKEIPWSYRIIVFPFGTCLPYIIALLPSCNLLRITLLNPISGHDITLPAPPISWFDYEHGPRFALSLWQSSLSLSQSSPSSPPCYTVFIIFKCFDSKLMFYRKGDRDWTRLNPPWNLSSFITFRGDLYGLRESEGARYLLAVYIAHPTPRIEEFCMDTSQLPLPKIHHYVKRHLVESPNGEELLLVLENVECDPFTTVGFQVFKADLSRKMWIRMETLGYHVLIIKDRQTLFLPAASVGHGGKGNCIYFSHISGTGQPPLKMFDLDSERMTDVSIPFPSQSYPSQSCQVMFVPNTC